MENLADSIGTAYQEFCRLTASDTAVDIILVNGIRFVGIDINRKLTVNVADVRRILLEPFAGSGIRRIVQVVGDSGSPIRDDRLAYARGLIERHAGHDSIIEYGFTNSQNDTNWLVENLQATNLTLTSRLVGNIVQVSEQAVTTDGWSALQSINHLTFVYRRDGLPTTFGDDVWLSDGVMNAEAGDVLICFDGGPQALKQCVNVLIEGIQVVVVTDLREHKASTRFSAAGLLSFVMKQGWSEDNANTYLTAHPPESIEQCQAILDDIRRLLMQKLAKNQLPIEIALS